MKWNVTVLPLLVLSAVFCNPALAHRATFSETYSNLPRIPGGAARIFFFRESHFVGAGAEARITIGGKKITEVNNDETVPIDVAEGTLDVGIDMWIEPGRAALSLPVESGKEYYVELGGGPDSPTSGMAGAAPYVLGSLRRVLDHPVCGGGWCAQLEDRDTAWPHIADTEAEPLISIVQ